MSFVGVVGVGKQNADVAERGRAEQRIADGMQQHVRVAMAFQSPVVRDLHAAQKQLAARFGRGESMDIVAEAGADLGQLGVRVVRVTAVNSRGRRFLNP